MNKRGLIISLTLAVILSAAPFLALADTPDASPGEGEICVKGVLTDEGVECQGLRGDDGKLYTLMGDKKTFKPGDRVCVIGKTAEVSYCMQGVTLNVVWIGKDCPDNQD